MSKSAIDQYVQQLPLISLLILPLFSAIFGLRYVNLKSVIHFQQGTLGSSPWRAAISMTFLSTPLFFAWCICTRTPSSIFFQLGGSLALVLTTITGSPILHYLPSPCISKYYQLRFLSNTLRSIMTISECSILLSTSILLIYLCASFLNSITNITIYVYLPLVAYFALFSIIFSGHSTMMNFSFILYNLTLISGIGLFFYYAIEDIQSIGTVIQLQNIRVGESITSLFIGFIVNFYLLNSSFLYQIYSPMPTMHKLRLTLTLYGIFQLSISIFIFLFSSIFLNFLAEHCKFSMSFSSFFSLTKAIMANKVQVYAVCASCALTIFLAIQWIFMSIMTVIWEENLARKLRNWNPIQQICSLQFAMLILTTVIVVVTVAAKLARLPIGVQLPTILYILFSFFGILAGVTVCGYYLPFCSSKGAISAFFITVILTIGNISIFLANNTPEKLQNSCILDDAMNSTIVVTRSLSMDKILHMAAHIPQHYQPIISILLFITICITISFLTGGQDQMGLDWNLIAFTWATSIRSPTSKRPFVDSESFRYAQQQNCNPTPSPDINVYR